MSLRNKAIKSAVAFLLLITISLRAESFSENVENILSDASNRPFNGTLLIFRGQDVLFENSTGAYGAPASSSQFVIGSISKHFTSFALLRLVDDGKLSLEDPIEQFIPAMNGADYSAILVRHLLDHTSGLKALYGSPANMPGSHFEYSPTVGYFLASRIIESVTGEKYAEYLNSLLSSRGLKDTLLADARDISTLQRANSRLATGFCEYNGNFSVASQLDEGIDLEGGEWSHPGGGVISTAKDLMQWLTALHDTQDLLSQANYQGMITPSAAREGHRYGSIGYGLGVQVSNEDDLFEVSHSGYINGYTSTLLYYPKEKVGVVILENVSWDLSDLKRVFAPHDDIRAAVRYRMKTKRKPFD